MAKKSNCLRKYGREWSVVLTEATRKQFECMFAGYLKHIGKKDGRYAIDRTFLAMKKYAALIPDTEKEKRIFLFSFTEFNILGDPKGMAFDVAYDSVDEMIDDGWAVGTSRILSKQYIKDLVKRFSVLLDFLKDK